MFQILVEDLEEISGIPDTPTLEASIAQANKAFVKAMEGGLEHWVVMYSGGKDSTATLVLTLRWLKQHGYPIKSLSIIYADTGVEIPTLHISAMEFLRSLKGMHPKIRIHEVRPQLEKSFWVLVVGKGYPPPHQRFRWCTEKMKIQPADEVVRKLRVSGSVAIITGVRFGESDVRDHRMNTACRRGGECGQGVWFEESKRLGATYLAPIAFWRECDVWDLVNFIAPKWGYPTSGLESVYQGRDTRFGCWTCTVVQQDKTMQRIVSTPEGSRYAPMLEFRNWLAQFAYEHGNRVKRANGVFGRLNLAARRKIFERICELEKELGQKILSAEEISAIKGFWENPKYGDSY